MITNKWLNDTVIYQIYPQSFYDFNGDGIGDLKGICEKLDYVKSLGVNAIWLNPFYESPFLDAGYDITDYYKVAKRYGTNDDFKALCDEAHKKGIKVLCDLVPGHTSIDHPWFKESSKKERNEYSDRYIWTNSKDETYYRMNYRDYERDGQYRCNFFAVQPSLNYGYAYVNRPWQFPIDAKPCIETRNEIKKVMEYWIKLGCDGFRVDMADCLIKHDNDHIYNMELWQDFRKWMDDNHPDCILMSEWGEPIKAIPGGFHVDMLVGGHHAGYTSLFRYEFDSSRNGKSYFRKEGEGHITDFLDSYLYWLEDTKNDGYISIPSSSHDNERLGYRRNEDEIKTAFAFLLTMPGIPIIYYGDEIGMDYIEGLEKEGSGHRGGSRTPMQWVKGEKNYGFSSSDNPYLPTDKKDTAPSVSEEENDEKSILNTVKRLIKLRHNHSSLKGNGEFKKLPSGEMYPFAYERSDENEIMHIVVNPAERHEDYYERMDIVEILDSHNAKIDGNDVIIDGPGYIIYKVN